MPLIFAGIRKIKSIQHDIGKILHHGKTEPVTSVKCVWAREDRCGGIVT